MHVHKANKTVAVLSIHPLYDTRIAGHIATVEQAGYDVSYLNWSGAHNPPNHVNLSRINLIHRLGNPAMSGSLFRYIQLLTWFTGQLIKVRPRIIHIHDLLLLPLAVLKGLTGAKVVFDVHEEYLSFKWGGGINRYASLYYRCFLRFVDALVGVSEKVLPVWSKAKEIIPNYQDRTLFSRHYTEPDSGPTVVYFGSLSTQDRDVMLMARIADICLSNHDKIVFRFGGLLRGTGSDENRHYFESLHTKFPTRFFWYGEMQRDDVILHTANASVGLLFMKADNPNYVGSSPNKIYEYLTAGVAVLATAGFQIGPEVEQEKAGILFEPDVAPEDVAETLLRIVKDRSVMNAMRTASSKLGTKYSWQEVAARYVRLYQTLEGK